MRLQRAVTRWLPLAVAICGMSGLVYLAVQQEIRQGANEPLMALAEDAASAVASGQDPKTIMPSTKVNLKDSLSPFVEVVDDKSAVRASNGVLNGVSPVPPYGVLAAAKISGEDRVTWQPQPDVRIASVVVPIPNTNEFVVAGRNMREIEKRIESLMLEVAIALITTLCATLVAAVILEEKR